MTQNIKADPFNETRYNEGIEMVAKQIVNMVIEDGGDDDMAAEYTDDTIFALRRRVEELRQNK